ncbi:MAG: M3 family metallopeptidase [Myxococcota bacterium]
MDNPLLDIELPVPFDRIRPEHVEPAIDALLEDARARIDAIVAHRGPRTWENTPGALDRATDRLDRAMGVVAHLEGVATTPALREAYNATRPKVSELYASIPTNEGLYRALQEYAETDEARRLDPTRARFVRKTLDELRRHGAELDAEGKRRLSEIDVELSRLTTRFAQHVLDATQAFDLVVTDEGRLAGLPESARRAARHAAESKGVPGWRFTLQAPSVIAVLTYLDDRAIRERIWRAYNSRGTGPEHDNRPLIDRILALRHEKARLLGYRDFADLVLEDRMAKTGDRAREFVDDLRARTQAAFERENAELLTFVRSQPNAPDRLEPWDVAYWSEKLRRARFDLDEEALRPYFEVERVLDGLFRLAERLFGVRIEAYPMPAWDPSVRTFAVRDGDGTLRCAFYVDPFPRDNKRGGAWMNGLIPSMPSTDGTMQPAVGLFCANVTSPSGDGPALLTHREVETLFHEFGHLLHHALSRVPVRSLAGTHVAWDFVELPSQIMQNWTWEREGLDLFARHHETGEPIPPALLDKMRRARAFRAANAMMRQLGFATLDLTLHRDHAPEPREDVMAVARQVLERHAPAPLPNDYAMVAGFTHLFASSVGYAAGYYSYKWAEVLEADAFSRFREEGVLDPAVGRAFREHILEKGDSRDPLELFEGFRGRAPQLAPLLARSGLLEDAGTSGGDVTPRWPGG